MNRILIYITLIVLAFFVAMTPSCSDEMKVEPPPTQPTYNPFQDGGLPVKLPVTRAINDGEPENEITSARLIVIKNSIVANNKEFEIDPVNRDSVYVLDTIPVGTVDMFIIVNEKADWELDLIAKNSTYFPENIEQKTLTFSAHPAVTLTNPIPMYRQFRNLHVSKEGAFSFINGDVIPMDSLGVVDRLYAKVTLALKAKFADMVNGGDPIKIDSVSIKSMPKHSYLTPSVGLLYPVSGGYFNGQVFAPADQNESGNYKADGAGLSDSIIWYIPEHRLSDPAYLTYISIKASLADNTDPDEQVEFKKIILGDGAATIPQDSLRIGSYNNAGIPINNWFITRNTHYDVKATIKSFSKTNESVVDVIMKVVGWTPVPINDPYIREHELKVSQDEFHITSTGAAYYEGVVTVETNHSEGWSADGTSGVTFEDSSSGSYTSSLSSQTGTRLRFRYAGSQLTDGYINVTAGPIVKKINLIRH